MLHLPQSWAFPQLGGVPHCTLMNGQELAKRPSSLVLLSTHVIREPLLPLL